MVRILVTLVYFNFAESLNIFNFRFQDIFTFRLLNDLMEPGESQSGLKKDIFPKRKFLGRQYIIDDMMKWKWFIWWYVQVYDFQKIYLFFHFVYSYKNPAVQWEQDRDDPSYIPGLVTEKVEPINGIPGLGGSSSSSSANHSSKKKNKKKQMAADEEEAAASATAARIGSLALNDDGADFELPDDVRAALSNGKAASETRPKPSQSQASSKPGGHSKRKGKQKGAQSSEAASESK